MKLLPLYSALLALAPVLATEVPRSNEDSIQTLRLEKFVMPEFPSFVQMTGGKRGIVTVAIGRTSEGHVDDVLVLDSTHARLSHAVTSAVFQWRFARPANQALPGGEIVPIVRFLFASTGVSVVSALTGGLADRTNAAERREDAPVILPGLDDLDPPPKILKQPMPTLKGALRDRVTSGQVRVKFFIDEEGRVRVPVVLEAASPELGEAALAAVALWRYEPPKIAGRPTIALETQMFQFGPASASAR